MKFLIRIFFTLLPSVIQAHHSKDHMMLLEDIEQVIQSTQQGAEGGLYWLLWSGVFILLLLGFVRWWKGRS